MTWVVGVGERGVLRFGTIVTGLGVMNKLAGVTGLFCGEPGGLSCGLGVKRGANNPGERPMGVPWGLEGVKTGSTRFVASAFSIWFARGR